MAAAAPGADVSGYWFRPVDLICCHVHVSLTRFQGGEMTPYSNFHIEYQHRTQQVSVAWRLGKGQTFQVSVTWQGAAGLCFVCFLRGGREVLVCLPHWPRTPPGTPLTPCRPLGGRQVRPGHLWGDRIDHLVAFCWSFTWESPGQLTKELGNHLATSVRCVRSRFF